MSTSATPDIAAYLARHEAKPLLRFITCGSVDDGKSTLIGRLLHESKALFEDQLATLASDSRRFGTQNGELDFALLVDGLSAEREQGITIDVAYRFFDTEQRKFIVADCPGHEQYTRNMATGASTADLAIVLVDARRGLLAQTRRHSYICALLGIRHVLLAVNKLDLREWSQDVFDAIVDGYHELAAQLGIASVQAIPVSALHGDNVVERSAHMPWYAGPSVLQHLEQVEPATGAPRRSLRLPVQWVSRPHQDFRGFAGTVAEGSVRVGERIVALPSGRRSTVSGVLVADVETDRAVAGQAVTITLADELDISRGDVIAAAGDPPHVADQFAVHLLWMSAQALLPGRTYLLRLGPCTVGAQVMEIKHKVDVNTQDQLAARRLELNEVGYCNISLDQPLVFEPYRDSRSLGGFILIDRQSNDTVAAGTIDFALRRAANVHWQAVDIDRAARAAQKGQHPRCVWFTGLSGSGKSTIANRVERQLHAQGYHTYLLDGDNVRHGLNRDLGFTDEDRVENIRRVAEVARLMVDAGLIVLVSFISPFRAERRMARELFGAGDFIEVFVDTPLAECERRDEKGLYAKARAGQLPNFTGISAPYEAPVAAELVLDTTLLDADACAETVLERLRTAD
jgi:bifunctional enzyme CysN/CysC